MKLKIMSLMLCVIMAVSILAGCGAKSEESQTEAAVTQEETTSGTDTKVASGNVDDKSKENKKVVVIKEQEDALRNDIHKNILAALEKGGYVSGKNVQITEISLGGDEKKCADALAKINEIKPDAVVISTVQFAAKSIAVPLIGSGIPVIINLGIENTALNFIDASSGKPKGNVTGLYTLPKDLQVNAFKMLNTISPINGKKAVFITSTGRFNKADVENNLKALGIELKEYCESKYIEDFQDAVNKYNSDDEVGWMLVGLWPSVKKDNSTISNLEFGKWDIANRKKPTVTYWDAAVANGMPIGLGVDLPETGTQAGEIAVKILEGEKAENINAVYPRKTSIVLNQKTAKEKGIVFPAEILGSAAKVYDK